MRQSLVIVSFISLAAPIGCEAPARSGDSPSSTAPAASANEAGATGGLRGAAPSSETVATLPPGAPGPHEFHLASWTMPFSPALAAWFEPVEVHEWGTFTSVQSPEGKDMEGLHHEEEPLPGFVHGRDGLCLGQMAKCLEFIPGGVTQKMETPVIYFHGAASRPLRVKVDFPLGVISQWYPAADSYAPELGSIHSGPVAGGSMTWTVAFSPAGYAPPYVDPAEIWAPSRRVASLPLRSNGEDENFIFYRGLGAFTLPIRTVSSPNGTLSVSNQGTETVPAAFLVRVTESGGGIVPLGSLTPDRAVDTSEAVVVGSMDAFLADARQQISAALEASGLDADESVAMVDTWTVSYFHTPGLRVLYVLPRSWTDAILPMSLDFIPNRTVRTLVGRIEVTTETEATSILANAAAAYEAGVMVWSLEAEPFMVQLGRHAEAKLRAIRDRMTDLEMQAWLDSAISWIAGQR